MELFFSQETNIYIYNIYSISCIRDIIYIIERERERRGTYVLFQTNTVTNMVPCTK